MRIPDAGMRHMPFREKSVADEAHVRIEVALQVAKA
jgi:hypothetical protein